MKKSVLALLVLIGVLSAVALGFFFRHRYRAAQLTASTHRPQADLSYLSILQSNQVLAKVGTTAIHGTDVRDALQMEFHGQSFHSSLSPQDLALKISETVDRVVEDEVLAQAAQRQGMRTTFTGPGARQDLAVQLVRAEQAKLPAVSDKELRTFYKEHGEKFYIPPGINVRELFLPVPSLSRDRKEEVEKAKRQAESLATRLRQGEAAEAMAVEFVPEAFRDRAKGYLFKGGVLTESEERNILKLRPGEVIGPIRVEGGVSVFQGVSQERARLIPFYQAQEKIKTYLETSRIQELRKTLIEKYKQDVSVQKFAPGASPLPTSKS